MKSNLKEIYNQIIQHDIDDFNGVFIKNPDLVFARDEDGSSLLHFAVENQNLEVVKKLIEWKLNPLISDNNGETPVIQAIMPDDVTILDYLLFVSASAITKDDEAFLLSTAVVNACDTAVKCMLDHNFDCTLFYRDDPILLWAIQSEKIDIIQYLVEHGACVDVSGEDGYTPLYNACAEGLIEIVRFLLDNNASVNLPSSDGCTPLIIASCYNHNDIVSLLIKEGADINKIDNEGKSALLYATEYGYEKIIQTLIKNGADKQIQDNKGRGVDHYLMKIRSKIKRQSIKKLFEY